MLRLFPNIEIEISVKEEPYKASLRRCFSYEHYPSTSFWLSTIFQQRWISSFSLFFWLACRISVTFNLITHMLSSFYLSSLISYRNVFVLKTYMKRYYHSNQVCKNYEFFFKTPYTTKTYLSMVTFSVVTGSSIILPISGLGNCQGCSSIVVVVVRFIWVKTQC